MATKILTVDDSKTIRLIVAKAFKPFDCQIVEAASGVEGLEVAAREKPDIILLDVTMPVMDGFEMLTKLKADDALKGIPASGSVVLLSSAALETERDFGRGVAERIGAHRRPVRVLVRRPRVRGLPSAAYSTGRGRTRASSSWRRCRRSSASYAVGSPRSLASPSPMAACRWPFAT